MAPMTRAQRREYHGSTAAFRNTRERLQREQARAQRHLQALEQALVEVGVAETLAEEVQWRLMVARKLLGRSLGRCFPPSLAAAPTTN